MTTAPYELGTDERPRLGLIVLQADETIEDDFRKTFDPDQVRLHISRVPSGAELTPGTIRAMEADLPAAAGLFPQGAIFDVVAYACTSGTSLIGPGRVEDLVRQGCEAKAVTNPLSATFAALLDLRAARIGIVSPYSPDIADTLRSDFEAAGFDVAATVSFGEHVEANVARIDQRSIMAAAQSLADNTALDAIFLSCTNLRTHGAVSNTATGIGIPVLSSNRSLAWHMSVLCRRAGYSVPTLGPVVT